MSIRLALATLAAAASTLSACAHADSSRTCLFEPADRAAVDATVRAFFDALRDDDRPAYQRLTTPTFYSFDVGKRYTGAELLDVVREARAGGVQLSWNVGQVDTHAGCAMAWAAWENVGSAGIPPKVEPVRWLESAVLVRRDGMWRIDFFHSTRAAKPR